MDRLNQGILRFLLWLVAASSVFLFFYSLQLSALFSGLGSVLIETFGTAFSALPFATLLVVLFVVRLRDLIQLLEKEEGFTSHPVTRLLGIFLILLPVLLEWHTVPTAENSAYISLELAGVSLVLVFYGSSLMLNPLTLRFMMPYAALYLLGIVAPLQLQLSFGEPLAAFSAILSAKLVGVAGMPVTWQGTDFEFVPRDGGALISGVVTPGCSSVYSISTFLGILGLMYLDFRKSLSSTVKLAVVGVVSLALLNALRIAALIWVGYDIGEGALLSLHNWLGYGIFLGFYLVALSVYAGMKSAGKGNVGIGAPR